MLPVGLTIAGSDSSAGAGIQADLKTFAALGVYGTSAITAVTAQNTVGVDAFEAIPPSMVAAQIRSVAQDLPVAAVKTGMLVNAAIIEAVAETVLDCKLAHLVVDTVMIAKSGHRLLLPEAMAALKTKLLPLAFLITPNIPEAEALVDFSIRDQDAMREAARRLTQMGASHVLVKGGHLEGRSATDILYDGKDFYVLDAERVQTTSTHGTGCTLSAAITAYLAHGEDLVSACEKGKAYLTQALKKATPLGHGHGPVNHFWNVNF